MNWKRSARERNTIACSNMEPEALLNASNQAGNSNTQTRNIRWGNSRPDVLPRCRWRIVRPVGPSRLRYGITYIFCGIVTDSQVPFRYDSGTIVTLKAS